MQVSRWIFAIVLFFALALGDFAHAQDRQGWSPQAKGAVIGGLGGAAAGALINKRNRAVGGVVGGVAGAGIGYAIGKHTDNKRKERARIAAENAAIARNAEYRNAEYRNARNSGRGNGTASRAAGATALAASAAPVKASDAAAFADRTGYLPNDTNGNRDAAYPTSEYRRKSW